MANEQKKSSKKFWLFIQNGGHDVQKWDNLSTFWKILALMGWGLKIFRRGIKRNVRRK